MREIKFRYMWQGKMVYVGMLEIIRQIGFELGIPDNVLFLTQPKIWDTDNKLTDLMQYTGLKDKNGKEIYEGDIVKWFKTKAIIIFRDGKFTADIHDKFDNTYWKTCEIIGNIWENGELLK